ncbi:HAD family hydrolase [Shewanella gaetbuli]|uniref:HAD-IA family hydrolase n=1 Tax=Shewanella gaetbuli TaxID=220752 RepID=A0A9X2CLE2_9GAMM|nr:HAD-IA family hydrolase [Shewanella gaetbuli]MCL1142475.1 HAD-IA family hydrolase [Shewanella gaetbuli]
MAHTQEYRENIHGVLFDLDGTLADTAPDLVCALNLSLAESGHPQCHLHEVKHAATHGSLALVQTALPNEPLEIQQAIQQQLLQHYHRINGDNSELFEHLAELLDYLDEKHIPYGIVTNKHARFARPLINKLSLTGRMKAIISGDSTLHPKPHAAPMLLAAQQLHVEPNNILYLGDAERDLVAAQNANMIGGAAHWGYLSDTDQPHNWPAQLHFKSSQCLLRYFVNEAK